MSKFDEYQCPVCKKEFEDGDDIVVCPDCGTPHHRECYNMIGHCVNKGLHSSGYDFTEEHKDAIEHHEAESNKSQAMPFPFYPPNTTQDENNGEEKSGDTQQQIFPIMNIGFANAYEADKDTIDGESISDVAATVKSNIPRFIGKFKQMEHTKKKTGWNWGAFFFGAYYYLFRKMYKQGVLILSVTTALSFATVFLITKFAPETYQAILSLSNSVFSGSGSFDTNAVNQILSAADYNTARIVSIVICMATLLVNIMATVFADYCYKKTVTEIIKKVDQQLDEGATFVQPPMFGPIDNGLGEKQIRQLYLSKKGGTTLFVPLMVYFALYIITTYL